MGGDEAPDEEGPDSTSPAIRQSASGTAHRHCHTPDDDLKCLASFILFPPCDRVAGESGSDGYAGTMKAGCVGAQVAGNDSWVFADLGRGFPRR